MSRKVILYIAASVDGFIAKPDDDLSFLSIVQKDGEDYGYHQFEKSVDTAVIGRRTYDWVIREVGHFPHADKNTFVITRTPKPDQGNVTFYSGDLGELITMLKSQKGQHIFCDGGAELVFGLLKDNLIDEMIISVIPILVGDGTRLFKNGFGEQSLKLLSCQQFETGLVQLHYECLKQH